VRFGLNLIVACPHCGGLARFQTLLSGDTFGATRWSDGKIDAPTLPMPPAFVRCRKCRDFYWGDEATPVDRPSRGDQAASRLATEPAEAEYLEVLDAGLVAPARERDARVLAWWRGNDARRGGGLLRLLGKLVKRDDDEARRRNLEALVMLFDDADPDDRLMKAEALRELGRFDEALAALARVNDEDRAEVAAILRRDCEARDSYLHRL